MQKKAEDALAWVFENKVKDGSKAQAAIVVMSADGAVRAMVGGRNLPNAGDFNRATQALRQTGSAFKPFIYAVAMDLGYSPMDYVEDTPMCIYTAGSGDWCPANYDKDYKGTITLTQALAESRNIPAVPGIRSRRSRSGQEGRYRFRRGAEPGRRSGAGAGRVGIHPDRYDRRLCRHPERRLVGNTLRLSELRLQGEEEPLFGAGGGIGERVISEKAARALTYMMTQVIETGTGGRARLEGREAAGKTGTTQSARDAWFVGFTADYVVGVWMGYDENTPLTGVTGAGLPAEIWHEVMVRVSEGTEPKPLLTEIPESAVAGLPGVEPPSAEDFVQPEDVPYFDGSNPNQPGMNEDDLAEQILRDVLGTKGN